MNIVKRIINKSRGELEEKIKEESRKYEINLNEASRIKLMRYHEDYFRKFKKEYKG